MSGCTEPVRFEGRVGKSRGYHRSTFRRAFFSIPMENNVCVFDTRTGSLGGSVCSIRKGVDAFASSGPPLHADASKQKEEAPKPGNSPRNSHAQHRKTMIGIGVFHRYFSQSYRTYCSVPFIMWKDVQRTRVFVRVAYALEVVQTALRPQEPQGICDII